MNVTQPNFHNLLYLKNHQNSNISLNQTDFPQYLPNQIHKTPQNIRKSIRQGKIRKNPFRNFQSEKEKQRYQQNQLQQRSSVPLKNSGSFLVNARKIKNFSEVTQKQQITFEDFVKSQRIQNKIFLNQIRKKIIKQADKNCLMMTKKFLENKRKLSPLKQGSLVIQRKPLKKQLNISFLNIQKAPLLNMYDKVNDGSDQIQSNQIGADQVWNQSLAVAKFNFESFKRQNKFQQLSPVSQMSMTGGFGTFQSKKRNSLFEDIGLGLTFAKSKKFIPPFQRYYYRDFIWKVAFSNGILLQCPKQYDKKFKFFIGKGNNSLLIKSLMKRRESWWVFTEKYEEANFVWTQIKIPQIFCKQQRRTSDSKNQSKSMLYDPDKLQKRSSFAINRKIMNQHLICLYDDYFAKHLKVEEKLDGTMIKRNKILKNHTAQKIKIENIKIHNHLPNNYIIGNKKALFYTMATYYEKMGLNPFEYVPQTYHIQNGLDDPQYAKFLNSYYPRQKKAKKQQRQNSPERIRTKNIWIVKPGQFTNRGNGISVCLILDQIKSILKSKQRHQNGNPKTFIIQSYLDKPFLYQRRKFDIRHYMMITSVNGFIKGYWYELGYIRTASYEYSVKTSLSSIHLTNDAVQKNLPDYGKYQKGNKLTYEEFQNYLTRQYGDKYNFYSEIYPKMKKIATDAIKASSLVIDPERSLHNFEVFGMDFMIDNHFKPWLIEINNNPCLQLSCPHLADIIPEMIENALKICIDSLVPPPAIFEQKRPKFSDNVLESNKFELVYDSYLQEEQIKKLLNGENITQKIKQLDNEMDQIFEDDGKELED